jgi:tRNA(Ile)-lysidine synthase
MCTIITDMRLELQPERYVVAVSGGVDSVALLDLLARMPGMDLAVAHFDHGIRADSAEDALFVATLAKKFDLPFFTERVALGSDASEATARKARYDFLFRVREQQSAAAIITAHHQDDLLETAIHNLIRGTGRRGLTSLRSTTAVQRPLLSYTKAEILAYALQQKLSWREDTTNHDQRYTRNYIRHRLLVRFDNDARQKLLSLIHGLTKLNDEIDSLLQPDLELSRREFTKLPHDVAREYLAAWLRLHGLNQYDRKSLERLTVLLKTRRPGAQLDVFAGHAIYIDSDRLILSKEHCASTHTKAM